MILNSKCYVFFKEEFIFGTTQLTAKFRSV